MRSFFQAPLLSAQPLGAARRSHKCIHPPPLHGDSNSVHFLCIFRISFFFHAHFAYWIAAEFAHRCHKSALDCIFECISPKNSPFSHCVYFSKKKKKEKKKGEGEILIFNKFDRRLSFSKRVEKRLLPHPETGRVENVFVYKSRKEKKKRRPFLLKMCNNVESQYTGGLFNNFNEKNWHRM